MKNIRCTIGFHDWEELTRFKRACISCGRAELWSMAFGGWMEVGRLKAIEEESNRRYEIAKAYFDKREAD